MCLTTWYVPIKVVVTSVPGRLILQRVWLLLYLHCRFYTEVKKKEICNSMCTCMCTCACVCKHACVECACVCVNTWTTYLVVLAMNFARSSQAPSRKWILIQICLSCSKWTKWQFHIIYACWCITWVGKNKANGFYHESLSSLSLCCW